MRKAIGRRGFLGAGAGFGAALMGATAVARPAAAATPAGARLASVLDFGATGNGRTDDTDAVNRALAMGGLVYFPAGTYLVSGLTAAVEGTWIRGDGPSTVLLKNDDGPVLTVTGRRVRVSDLVVDGDGGDHDGPGLVVSGVFPHVTDLEVRETRQEALVFPANGSGHSAIVSDCILQVWQGQLGQANEDTAAVSLPDDHNPANQATNRQFTNIHANACLLFTDNGSDNAKWVACTGRNFVITGAPAKLLVSACRLASSGTPLVVAGNQVAFTGNALAGDVTLKAYSSTFTGNLIAGKLTIVAGAFDTIAANNSSVDGSADLRVSATPKPTATPTPKPTASVTPKPTASATRAK